MEHDMQVIYRNTLTGLLDALAILVEQLEIEDLTDHIVIEKEQDEWRAEWINSIAVMSRTEDE